MAKKHGATANLLHCRRHRLKTALCLVPGPLLLAVFICIHLRTLGLLSPAARCAGQTAAVDDLVLRLRSLATFHPLRDPREPAAGAWFVSALNDTAEPEGEARHLALPSAASAGRVLCVRAPPGVDTTYALAWRDALPRGAALLPGLAFVSESPYDYDNLWHGLTALAPFVSWHARGGCRAAPARWALFQRGAARTRMSGWLTLLAEAVTGAEMVVETFLDRAGPVCFEEAVVFRRQMQGLSRERLRGAFDLMRCKARARCGVVDAPPPGAGNGSRGGAAGPPAVRVTLLLRRGARAFKDEAAVRRVFEKECARVAGCVVTTAHTDNLTFCDQVRLLSATDVLITPHGAQVTNLLFMDRNSSVMEFYPLGWRQRAGGGQFVYRWMADRVGMRHEGSWWDPDGEPCPDSPDILSCYKSRQIGHDEAYFAEWAARVFAAAKERKMGGAGRMPSVERLREAAACKCT
ncbi:uncharacterized protein C2845_PM13G18300 [Panicum miliaceum]|uniref:Glycosyltransferase 61 catalytic domain-containing protein n=1 Tax=Panicum miliaceum TaxID=4540 RepID=A0A3L6RKD9_PANMI|nr:uncharacterized protein C2845_PM13G18300 [Panicum miliaceum]